MVIQKRFKVLVDMHEVMDFRAETKEEAHNRVIAAGYTNFVLEEVGLDEEKDLWGRLTDLAGVH